MAENKPEDRDDSAKAVEKYVFHVRDLLDKQTAQLEMAMPDPAQVALLKRTVVSMLRQKPDLMKCHPQTVVGCTMECAQLRLNPEPALAQAYFVPREVPRGSGIYEAQFQIGYRGMIQLAYQSGSVRTFRMREVYEWDQLRYRDGTKGFIEHVEPMDIPADFTAPDWSDDSRVRAYYAVCELVNGGVPFLIWPKWRVHKLRDKFASDRSFGWTDHPVAMGRKTVGRHLWPELPVNDAPNMARAMNLEMMADAQLSQHLAERHHVEEPTSVQVPSAAAAPKDPAGLAESIRNRTAAERSGTEPPSGSGAEKSAPASEAADGPPGYYPPGQKPDPVDPGDQVEGLPGPDYSREDLDNEPKVNAANVKSFWAALTKRLPDRDLGERVMHEVCRNNGFLNADGEPSLKAVPKKFAQLLLREVVRRTRATADEVARINDLALNVAGGSEEDASVLLSAVLRAGNCDKLGDLSSAHVEESLNIIRKTADELNDEGPGGETE